MIISPQYRIAFLPIENANSEVMTAALYDNDPGTYIAGDYEFQYVEPPTDYEIVVSRRASAKERLYSFYLESKTNTFMGYNTFFSTFQECVNFLNKMAYVPFLNRPSASLFSPRAKKIYDQIVTLPIPQRVRTLSETVPVYMEYGSYAAQILELTGLTVSSETLDSPINVNDDFIGSDGLCNLYDWGIQT